MAGNALKFEFLMSHDTNDSVKQVITRKSLYSCLITLIISVITIVTQSLYSLKNFM